LRSSLILPGIEHAIAMAYLRFIVAADHPDTGVADGVFRTAYALRDDPRVSSTDRELLAEKLAWFSNSLPVPKRFNRTSSKGYYRRKTRGIAWVRDNAREHITRMHEIKRVLEANGHVVHLLREERVGYVVYSDEAQVIAEPFADTRTSH
jgi:hypothetical protein